MIAKFLEFIAAHYVLSGTFIILVVLLIMQQSRNSGRNLSSRELTAMVNRDEAFILDIRPKKTLSRVTSSAQSISVMIN